MSNRRLTWACAAVTLLALAARPSAQPPTLDEVLKRSATYVAEFRAQFSGLVAEETYRQSVALTARITNNLTAVPPRTLRSDLLLLRPANSDRYVELRDVFEVDGSPIRDRRSRPIVAAASASAAAPSTAGSGR